MARFVINTPITTREPTVTVDAGLPIGRHGFRLVVVDARGVRSTAHDAVVDIQRVVGPIGPVGPVGPLPLEPRRPVVEPDAPLRPTGRPVSPPRQRPRGSGRRGKA
jgi:hypothetical protein